jgi:hypothetical protein
MKLKEFIKKIINEEIENDNYSSYNHMKPYKQRKDDFINSINNFNDFNDNKINEFIDYFGYEGFNDKEDAFNFLKNEIDFYKKIPNQVTLYRVVGVKNKKLINKDELGRHYTSNKLNIDYDMLSSIGYDNWDSASKPYIIEVSVLKSEIDIIRTLKQNLNFPNEHEITLKNKGKNAKIIKIEKMKI